jgi:hypothetical protein
MKHMFVDAGRSGVRGWRLALGCIVGSLLAGCGTSVSAPPVTTATHRAPVSPCCLRAFDIGSVRVWAPVSWQVIVEPDPCSGPPVGASCLEPPCAPGGEGVHVSSVPPSLHCKEAIKGADSVWITYWPGPWLSDARPPVQALPGWRGRAIVVTAPRLDAVIYGFGPSGVAAARSYGRSALASVNGATLPVVTPGGFRSLRFGDLEASVPRSWQVRDLTGSSALNPGECGGSPFNALGTPTAFLGFSRVTASCPFVAARSIWTAMSWPANGIWMATTLPAIGSTVPLPLGVLEHPSGVTTMRTHAQHGLVVSILQPVGELPAGSVSFVVAYRGQQTYGVLGLGDNPLTAEQVLSSIRPS